MSVKLLNTKFHQDLFSGSRVVIWGQTDGRTAHCAKFCYTKAPEIIIVKVVICACLGAPPILIRGPKTDITYVLTRSVVRLLESENTLRSYVKSTRQVRYLVPKA